MGILNPVQYLGLRGGGWVVRMAEHAFSLRKRNSIRGINRRNVTKVLSLILIGLGMSTFAAAAVPEIDPGSGASAITLLAGAILLFRNRASKN